MLNRFWPVLVLAWAALGSACVAGPSGTPAATAAPTADARFNALAARFVDEFPASSPVLATSLGDHRFDHLLNDVSASGRARTLTLLTSFETALKSIDRSRLSRANQIDAELLRNELESSIWSQQTLQEWAWNPMNYVNVAGGSIYSLLARDFAPLAERLNNAASRLEQFPRFYSQARGSIDIARVPPVHAETAAKQNSGVKSIIATLIRPQLDTLDAAGRERMEKAIAIAEAAIDEQQVWLDEQVVPNAAGDFRIGAQLFDTKLKYALHSPLSRAEINKRARREFKAVRAAMYNVARGIVSPDSPDRPTAEQQQAVIEAGLELAYAKRPARGQIVALAREQLEQATEFVRLKNIVEVPDDPIEIIIMPEFQRGVAIAYCDPPGPLDKGQKTFYAVAPLPESWTDEQVESFLREYNTLSIQDLTIHEAMPGHYLQLALSNRHPSTLRKALYSGPFVEGWAVYAERVMVDEGYLDNDPLMRLINLKWYLRAVANAIIDQAIHVDGMTRDEAMELMTNGAFQQEREAAGKWTRAQLTSSQLSSYFVGFQEHADMRAEAERAWGANFSLRKYHDTVLSFGSPPAQFVRAELLKLPIPQN